MDTSNRRNRFNYDKVGARNSREKFIKKRNDCQGRRRYVFLSNQDPPYSRNASIDSYIYILGIKGRKLVTAKIVNARKDCHRPQWLIAIFLRADRFYRRATRWHHFSGLFWLPGKAFRTTIFIKKNRERCCEEDASKKRLTARLIYTFAT